MAVEATDVAWIREAVRVHRRYQIEMVEALGLCPWAEASRKAGRVTERVLLQRDDGDLAPSLAAIAEVAAEPAIEVAFLVYPRLGATRRGFDEFASRLRTADAGRYEVGKVPFVFAVFHPDAQPDTGDPERLIPFLRRTPDPTFQFVRASVLDSVRGVAAQGTQFIGPAAFEALQSGHAPVPLREKIARSNLTTVQRFGVAAVTRVFDDIRRDRDESYARLG
jgi:hypothetical protein